MPLSAGERLGPYEILASIGEGGMGEVWKARDTRLDRIVALKVSKHEFSERFEREARSIAALNHPHICQLYDVVISKDAPNYLVMEFVQGSPLKGPLPVEKGSSTPGRFWTPSNPSEQASATTSLRGPSAVRDQQRLSPHRRVQIASAE